MIHDLKKQGLSHTAIGRQLGISRRTVARRLKQELAVPVYGPRAPKQRLIEPFKGYLQDRVHAWPDLSARRLFREIKKQGYLGGYSMIMVFLREVRPPSVQLYERRYETPPGKQAQVDFAYFEVEFTDAPGTRQVVWLFTLCGAVGTLYRPRTPQGGFGFQSASLGAVLPEPKAAVGSSPRLNPMVPQPQATEPEGPTAVAAHERTRGSIPTAIGDQLGQPRHQGSKPAAESLRI